MNIYLKEIHQVLPRLIAGFDANPVSETVGHGDRLYWAWKTLDFGNATYQGSVNGLSRLVAAKALPDGWSQARMLERIDQMICAVADLRARDGSLSEAYPNESSFCVTGLVLYDLMVAIDTLGEQTGRRTAWLSQVEPLVTFLDRADETHGQITNHLASAAAGLARYDRATGRDGKRTDAIIAQIKSLQSQEGWFSEYGGADAGYQSLTMGYLADLAETYPDAIAKEDLNRALRFLGHFCCPDGSFGGYIGWRGTRFIAPGGLEALTGLALDATQMAAFARTAIARSTVPTLNVFDAPNLPVFFNSWVQAALAAPSNAVAEPSDASVPLPPREDAFAYFKHAGLITRTLGDSYCVINTRKGGVLRHFVGGQEVLTSGGVRAEDRQGRAMSSQSLTTHKSVEIEQSGHDAIIQIGAPLVPVSNRRPTPFEFAMLRILSVTLFRWRTLNEIFKAAAVKILISGSATSKVKGRREIYLRGETCRLHDQLDAGSEGLATLVSDNSKAFSAIHMANQGFWQIGDEVQ